MGAPEEVDCCSLEENLGLLLRDDLIFLTLSCLEAIDPIYVMFGKLHYVYYLEGVGDIFQAFYFAGVFVIFW